MSRVTRAILLTSCAAAWLADAPAHGRDVTGKAGAVATQTTSALPDQPFRTLSIGSQVFVAERIRTDVNGSTELLFLDGTYAFVAPLSEVILNSYRSDRRSIQLFATVIEGDFRVTVPAVSYAAGGAAQVQTASSFDQSRPAATSGYGVGGGAPYVSPVPPPPPGPSSSTGGDRTQFDRRAERPSLGENAPPPFPPQTSPPPPQALGAGLSNVLLHLDGSPGQGSIDVTAISGGLDIKVSVGKGGGWNVLSLGGPVSINTSTASTRVLRSGYVVQVDRSGAIAAPTRATPEMFDSVAAGPTKSASPAAGASPAAAGAITSQNSAHPLAQLLPQSVGAPLREVDPRRLDLLAGNTPSLIGTFRQQTYISSAVDAGLAASLLNVLPATVTVSAPRGTQTVTFTRAPNGTLIASPAGATLAGLNALGRPAVVTIATNVGARTVTLSH